jgi:hypothetical protein
MGCGLKQFPSSAFRDGAGVSCRKRPKFTHSEKVISPLIADCLLRWHDQAMSRYQLLPPYFHRAAILAFLLMTAACEPVGEVADKDLPPDEAKLLAKLEAMDGQSGEFEGILRPSHREGSSFEFCTEKECPDVREITCQPEFGAVAASTLSKLWEDHDNKAIYMFASATIRTGSLYGHLGEHLCEITISQVRQANLSEKTVLIRSKRFPDLVRLPE